MKRLSRFAAGVGSILILGFFAAPPVFAQRPPSGGGRPPSGGGGSYHGRPPGGGSYHGGGGGGYHGYHGYRGYGGHRYYGGYWGYPGWGWGLGWGGWWGWGPGYWGGYYYGAPYGYVGYAPGQYAPLDWTVVKTDVSPEEARIYLDGHYIGTADDFDGYPDFLYLQPGKYQLEFRLEGFESQTVPIQARAGARYRLDNKLKKIPGAKQYGSYETPEPEGGLQRYWGKTKDAGDVPVGPEAGPGTTGDWRGQNAPQQPQQPQGGAEAPPAAGTGEPAEGAQISAVPAPTARARIQFRIDPGDAVVYLDDHFVGTGEELSSLSRGLIVAPGAHKVVVSRPGYATEASQVDVTPERPQLVEITLERP